MADVQIWNGDPGKISGSTAYGYFDKDTDFCTDAAKFAIYTSRYLGYPIVEIELNSSSFASAYEASVIEYSEIINEFNISENILSIQGAPLDSNLTHKNIAQNLAQSIRIASNYAAEAGIGGYTEIHTGSFQVQEGVQLYDLQNLIGNTLESGKLIEITKVYHHRRPASAKYFDPFVGSNAGVQSMMDEFGWGDMGVAMPFIMLPAHADALRIQAIEFNDTIRRSAYSFEILPINKLRIFPIPVDTYNCWVEYRLLEDRQNLNNDYWNSADGASDLSNAPYALMEYSKINSVGRRWIHNFALATVKGMLGHVRGKYSSIPIPDDETTLDGDTLRSEAETEKAELRDKLRELLEKMSRREQLVGKAEETEQLRITFQGVPLGIYTG